MSVRRLREIIGKARLVAADETWFPRWRSQSAARLKRADDQAVPVDYHRVVDFLKTLKSDGKLAWQRLQAVRAMEFYARSVREAAAPELADIRRKPGKMAEKERTSCRSGIVTQNLIDFAADRRAFVTIEKTPAASAQWHLLCEPHVSESFQVAGFVGRGCGRRWAKTMSGDVENEPHSGHPTGAVLRILRAPVSL